jgi:acetyl esterase
LPLRPVLRPLLALANALEREEATPASVPERRAAAASGFLQMKLVTARGPHRVRTMDLLVPVAGGQIMIRIYRPVERSLAPMPTHLYLHGGSFWLDSVEVYDPICRWFASTVDCQLISVDYRLAPEHPYPTATEDAYAALCWVADHAEGLAVDPDRLSVGGFSAGGNLATVLTLMTRDRSGPTICFQALQSPVTDLTLSQPSLTEFGTGYGLTRASLVEAYGFYLVDPTHAREAYVSPLLATDLSGLPPAFISTCEYDPLRDEGEAYGRRLKAVGVPVEMYRIPGHVHSSIYLTRVLPSAREAMRRAADALRRAYGLSEPRGD